MKVRRPSLGLIVAVMALIAALSGSAIAASAITGSQIKDGTIGVSDLSKKAVAKLHGARGQRGQAGNTGSQGPKGDTGAAGGQGPPGLPGAPGQKGDTGPSDAFVFTHDADIALPNTSTPLSAPLAAGSYVILAKFVLDNDANFTSRPTCTLTAGTDTDVGQLGIDSNAASDDVVTATLTVMHSFAGAGTVTLGCNSGSTPPAVLRDIKITAIRVGNLSNTAI